MPVKIFVSALSIHPICPDKFLFIDTRTGKPIPHLVNPRAVYVRDTNGFQFTYSTQYPPGKTKVPGIKTATAYINTPNTIAAQNVPQAVQAKATNGVTLILTFLFNSISVPGTDKSILACGILNWFCSTPTGGMQVVPKSIFGGFCSGICTPPPPPGAPAPAPGAAPAAPAKCGVPGSPPCAPNSERNSLPPDPSKGRIMDPATCNADGTPKTPGGGCTSLTDPNSAQEGDPGYAPQCASKRQDMNPTDDPAGVDQASCCASAVMLREGCCGQQCTVWSQNSKDGTWRDGANHVCTNDDNASSRDNTCGRPRADTVPPPACSGNQDCTGGQQCLELPNHLGHSCQAPNAGGGGGGSGVGNAGGGAVPAQPAQPLLPNEHGPCGNFGSNCGAGLSCHYPGGSNAPGTCERIPGYVPPAPPEPLPNTLHAIQGVLVPGSSAPVPASNDSCPKIGKTYNPGTMSCQ